ncbi:hypothetical protein ACFL0V_01360 [Nanoarchaeota archaeon]
MKAIRPDKRHVLSTREAMAEVEGKSVERSPVETDEARVYEITESGLTYNVHWRKELIEGGGIFTQQDWIQRLRGTEWTLPTTTVLRAVYDEDPDWVEGYLRHGIMTGSHVDTTHPDYDMVGHLYLHARRNLANKVPKMEPKQGGSLRPENLELHQGIFDTRTGWKWLTNIEINQIANKTPINMFLDDKLRIMIGNRESTKVVGVRLEYK